MILECKSVAEKMLDIQEGSINELIANGKQPHIAIVRVEGDKASEKYVANKVKKCAERNVKSSIYLLPNNVTMEELLRTIDMLNKDNSITGILLQLPLPKHLDSHVAINAISPSKDIDCLTTHNAGRLFEGDMSLCPCTPYGIVSILDSYGIDVEGKDVLIINRSMLVGLPLFRMMTARNATVTMAHSKTVDLRDKMLRADIIVTAVGKKDFIDKETLALLDVVAKYKEKKTIIDVSINVNEEGKLCGDVYKDNDYVNSLQNINVTPVPGGVGLTTVASLLVNAIQLIRKDGN